MLPLLLPPMPRRDQLGKTVALFFGAGTYLPLHFCVGTAVLCKFLLFLCFYFWVFLSSKSVGKYAPVLFKLSPSMNLSAGMWSRSRPFWTQPEPVPWNCYGSGAGSGLSLKRAFLTVESTYLESRYVEWTLCRKNQNTTNFWPEGTPGDLCMKQFSEKNKVP